MSNLINLQEKIELKNEKAYQNRRINRCIKDCINELQPRKDDPRVARILKFLEKENKQCVGTARRNRECIKDT